MNNKSVQLWQGEDRSLLFWESDRWRKEFKSRQPGGLMVRLFYESSAEQDLLLKLRQASSGGNLWSAPIYLELTNFLQMPVKSALADLLWSVLENPSSNLFLLLLESGNVAWSKALPKKIKKLQTEGCLLQRDFPAPNQSQRLKWLQNQAKQMSVDLPIQSASALLSRAGLDCWRLYQELNKLSAYAVNRPVTVADVDLLVEPVWSDNSFALLEALGKRDIKSATAIMVGLFKSGDSPQALIGLLSWHLRVLTGLRQELNSLNSPERLNTRQLAASLGLHPFVVSRALQQMPYYSVDRLKELWLALTEADIKLKTSALPAETILSLFFVRMCKNSL